MTLEGGLLSPEAEEIAIDNKDYDACNKLIQESSFDYPDEDPVIVQWANNHSIEFNSGEVPVIIKGVKYWMNTDTHAGTYLNLRERE